MADRSHAPLGVDGAELRAQIDSLRREVTTIADVVGEIAGPASRKRVARTAKELSKQTKSALSDVEDYVGRSADLLNDALRERPLQTALLAFGAGLLVAKLFLTRRD